MCANKKYKYLNYIPPPVGLERHRYDLVDDEAFCTPDGRMPFLWLLNQVYSQMEFIKERKLWTIRRIENQNAGFTEPTYLTVIVNHHGIRFNCKYFIRH